MASYQDALTQFSQQPNTAPPNILTARFGEKTMWGYGLNIEQALSKDIGIFARWSWNTGNTETQTLDVGSSLSGGVSIKGVSCERPQDTIGLGYAISGISAAEMNYLQLGGSTAFIGDGALSYKPEQVFEAYYSAKIYKGFYMSADYQYIANPAYNANRGPVNIIGLRAHIEL
jgi:carbohydrate-selective porin OprB